MALYDLRCEECKKEYQVMVPYSKLAEQKCPQCGSKNKKQVFKANVKGPVSSSSNSGGNSGFT